MTPRILLALLCLLAPATSASAESLWVLWSNFISSNPCSEYWWPLDA